MPNLDLWVSILNGTWQQPTALAALQAPSWNNDLGWQDLQEPKAQRPAAGRLLTTQPGTELTDHIQHSPLFWTIITLDTFSGLLESSKEACLVWVHTLNKAMEGFLQGTKAFGNLLNELPQPSKQAEVWLDIFHTNTWYPPSTVDTRARQTDPRAFVWPAHYKRQKKKKVSRLCYYTYITHLESTGTQSSSLLISPHHNQQTDCSAVAKALSPLFGLLQPNQVLHLLYAFHLCEVDFISVLHFQISEAQVVKTSGMLKTFIFICNKAAHSARKKNKSRALHFCFTKPVTQEVTHTDESLATRSAAHRLSTRVIHEDTCHSCNNYSPVACW